MSAPYPIYKAQNPKHLVDETLAIVRGLTQPTLKSASNFGNQMICIANYFLMKEVREESQNSGKFIDEWNREYARDDKNFKAQASWCAIFMWKIADEGASLLSCKNPFPQYDHKFFNEDTKSFISVLTSSFGLFQFSVENA